MLREYLKTTLRTFSKNKSVFVINLVGLATGFAVCIFIALWINKEYQYNRFLKEGNNKIFQVVTNYPINGNLQSARATSYPIISAIQNQIPEVKGIAFLHTRAQNSLLHFNKSKIQASGRLVSSNFFSVINEPFLFGNAKIALDDPLSIVISEDLAQKLFGREWEQIISGATITLGEDQELDVAGVFKDFPENSTIQFDYCTSYTPPADENIGNYNYETFVQTSKSINQKDLEKKINKLSIQSGSKTNLILQPFEDIYLYSNFQNGHISGGRIEYIYIFAIAALFILVMACINFMNLHIASSFKKTKEIGIKKIVGASRSSIILQFLMESYTITILAILIAIFIDYFTLPYFNYILTENIGFPLISSKFWLTIVIFAALIGFFSGIYPALLLTSFRPVSALNINQDIKIGGVWLRQALFIFQFFVSVALIFFTYNMAQQIVFLKNKNLGYNKKNILFTELTANELAHLSTVKNTLFSASCIESITACSADLESGSPMVGGVDWPNKSPFDSAQFGIIFIDSSFLETLGIPVVKGSKSLVTTTGNVPVILNKKAANIMGGSSFILNRTLEVWGEKAQVTAIVNDFHFNSLFSPIEPLIMAYLPNQTKYLVIKVIEGREEDVINILKNFQLAYSPDELFSYTWIENSLDKLYQGESNMEKIAQSFSVLSIIISVLGLFGLVNLTIQRRMRELGIRRVLGANKMQIVYIIFKSYLKLITIAVITAVPTSYLILHLWLNKFAYKITISFSSFLFPIILMIAVSLLTLLYHSLKVSKVNPVIVLKEN